MSYAANHPVDLGRPLYLDRVCLGFPDITVIAGLGDWPSVPALVGAARRHKRTCQETSQSQTVTGR